MTAYRKHFLKEYEFSFFPHLQIFNISNKLSNATFYLKIARMVFCTLLKNFEDLSDSEIILCTVTIVRVRNN